MQRPENDFSQLKRRAVRGVFWTTAASLSARIVQTITTLLLAGLLLPEDFGTVAVALVVINSLALIRDMGLSQSLIHRRGDIRDAADTAFVLLPLQGLMLAALAALAAPLVAGFFNVEGSIPVIRVLALSLALSSFSLVPSSLLERDLSFGRKFIPETVPVLGYSATAVTAAAAGLGVWSLVIAEVARSFLQATIIWPFSSYRPSWRFSRRIARELFRYGRHIVGAGVAIFLFTTLDNAFIARMLGTEQLGFYVLAFTLATVPASQVAQVVSRVMFPAYSSIQHEREALSRAYLRTVEYVSAVAAPIALGTLAIGPLLLNTLYQDKWEGTFRVLQILALYGFFRAVGGTAGEILKAVGKPWLLARVTYLQLVLVVALAYPAIRGAGIEGAAILFTGAMFAGVLVATILASAAVAISPLKVIARAAIPLAISALAAAGAYGAASLAPAGSGPLALSLSIAVFTGLYLAVSFLWQRRLLLDMAGLIKSGAGSNPG